MYMYYENDCVNMLLKITVETLTMLQVSSYMYGVMMELTPSHKETRLFSELRSSSMCSVHVAASLGRIYQSQKKKRFPSSTRHPIYEFLSCKSAG